MADCFRGASNRGPNPHVHQPVCQSLLHNLPQKWLCLRQQKCDGAQCGARARTMAAARARRGGSCRSGAAASACKRRYHNCAPSYPDYFENDNDEHRANLKANLTIVVVPKIYTCKNIRLQVGDPILLYIKLMSLASLYPIDNHKAC
eukprot:1106271-Pleurochrysis_carterae.AAC.3